MSSDDDVLNAAELVKVRQDQGVQPGAEEPDWELIEKLEEIASKDEVVLPDVSLLLKRNKVKNYSINCGGDLDAVAAQPQLEVPVADAPHPSGDSSEIWIGRRSQGRSAHG